MAAVVAAIGFQGSALVQANPLPWDGLTEPAEYVTFEVDDSGWTLYPVITADDVFVGFFGYLPDEFVVGDNVSLLWLTPDNGDGTWSMYGWSHTDIKIVSAYLDELTATQNVLSDTGLDVFAIPSQPITQPKSMPFGVAVDDPFEPIVAATQDPEIAEALIAQGAAGAPNLTKAVNVQPVDGCPPAVNNDDGHVTKLDMELAIRARMIQEMMIVWLSDPILDSLMVTGFDQDEGDIEFCFCIPGCHNVWGAWGPWSCANPNPFLNGAGSCRCTQCSRTRTGTRVCVNLFCTTTSTAPITATQGPMEIAGPVNTDGSCGTCP
tara:strand:+ start:420 stop:1382 length:963 start_codon:yes stop_codon:yes gene_type:complete